MLTLGSLFDGIGGFPPSGAIPCSSDVLGRIAAFVEGEERENSCGV